RLAVCGDDDVALPYARSRCRRACSDIRDQCAFGRGRRSARRRQSLRHHDTDAASTHLAVLEDLIHHETCSGGRHGEADADIGAGTEYRAVDADHAAVQRDQRPARITWIDRRIGLDVALVAVLAEAASQSADD